jgi:hypothetical protein
MLTLYQKHAKPVVKIADSAIQIQDNVIQVIAKMVLLSIQQPIAVNFQERQ